MILPPKFAHPEGEGSKFSQSTLSDQVEVDTYDGKIFVEWDPSAAVTPLGQLPFFIQFLKLAHRIKLVWPDFTFDLVGFMTTRSVQIVRDNTRFVT